MVIEDHDIVVTAHTQVTGREGQEVVEALIKISQSYFDVISDPRQGDNTNKKERKER